MGTIEICVDCKFWYRVTKEETEKNIYGHCKRFPPQFAGIIIDGCTDWDGSREWRFPLTESKDHCGEFDRDFLSGRSQPATL